MSPWDTGDSELAVVWWVCEEARLCNEWRRASLRPERRPSPSTTSSRLSQSQPYANGQLPNLTVRKEMLALLLMLPVQVDHLKRSGIGRVVMGLLNSREVGSTWSYASCLSARVLWW